MNTFLHANWLYIVTFLMPPRYFWNIARGAGFFVGGLLKLYRPHPGEWLLNIGLGLDQFANSVIAGDPRETISSRAAKARAEGKEWGCVLCRFLGWCATRIAGKPTDHCAQSVEANVGGDAVIPD